LNIIIEILSILSILIAFGWLLHETQFLTIDLMPEEEFDIARLIDITIAIVVGTSLIPVISEFVEDIINDK
jgi:hypothetical protein